MTNQRQLFKCKILPRDHMAQSNLLESCMKIIGWHDTRNSLSTNASLGIVVCLVRTKQTTIGEMGSLAEFSIK